jgi:putrescine transport system substrate-binding protein
MNKKFYLFISILGISLASLHVYRTKTTPVSVVNFYGWYGAIPRDVFEDFEEETGTRVTVDTFDDNATAEAKLVAGNSGYDVVVVSLVPYVGRQCLIGVYQKLDRGLLPNLLNLGEIITRKFEQNGGNTEYIIPLFWGTTGLIYNEEVFEEVFGKQCDVSCDLVFCPKSIAKLRKRGVCFPIEAVDAFMQAGAYLGVSPYRSEEEMNACARALIAVRRLILRFGASTVVQDILSGEVCAALGMSDNAFKAIQVSNSIGKRTRYVRGKTMWIDCIGIPKTAPHKNSAHKLINFLLRPEIAARITNHSGILTNIPRATKLFKPEIADNEQICPSDVDVADMILGHVSQNASDMAFEKRIERKWMDIKTCAPVH